MKTLGEVEPRIPISSVPYTISTSGSYYLTGDLTSAGTGIMVNADNVTTDLMGHSLNGPGSGSGTNYGIYMNGRSNVEVRNGTVRRFGSEGIYLNGNNLVDQNTAYDNNQSGGSFVNMPILTDCTYGVNHAP